MFCIRNKKKSIPMYTPDNIIVGLKGVYITRTCYPDAIIMKSLRPKSGHIIAPLQLKV